MVSSVMAEPLRTVTTSDGRVVAFAVWGDPGGFPVLALHGTPGCRLERWPAAVPMSAAWAPTADGYSVDVEISDCIPKAIDILINEKPIARERRRGQLVLSGGRGEFVYLRGDRHEQTHLVPIRLTDE